MIDGERDWFWHGPEPPNLPAKDWGKNPYTHECDLYSSCTEECQACAWMRARANRQREDFGYGVASTGVAKLVDGDHLFLAAAKISWEGDTREENR